MAIHPDFPSSPHVVLNPSLAGSVTLHARNQSGSHRFVHIGGTCERLHTEESAK